MRHFKVCALVFTLAGLGDAEPAGCQETRPVFGVHYGTPLKWSALLGLGLTTTDGNSVAFLAGEPGIGGWRVSAGYLRMTGNLGNGWSIRASVLRSTQRAWRVSPHASFAGVEVQFSPVFALGPRLGVFVPLGASTNRKGLIAADLGFAL